MNDNDRASIQFHRFLKYLTNTDHGAVKAADVNGMDFLYTIFRVQNHYAQVSGSRTALPPFRPLLIGSTAGEVHLCP